MQQKWWVDDTSGPQLIINHCHFWMTDPKIFVLFNKMKYPSIYSCGRGPFLITFVLLKKDKGWYTLKFGKTPNFKLISNYTFGIPLVRYIYNCYMNYDAPIAAGRCLGCVYTRFICPEIKCFAHLSENSSSSVILDEEHLWRSILKSHNRFSIQFKSELALGHHNTSRYLDLP